jgi:electron transport complex protein RnfG
MKEIARLIIVLTLISAAAGLLLAYTNKVTLEPIGAARRKETIEALALVLPPFDNQPSTCTNLIAAQGRVWTFYVARRNGQYAGAAFESSSRKGYGGEIKLMVGVTAEGMVKEVRILSQQETPGLGTKVAETPFRGQLANKPVEGTVWKVRKDGGAFDAVTGATISSRAVLEAIQAGLDVYRENQSAIAATGP